VDPRQPGEPLVTGRRRQLKPLSALFDLDRRLPGGGKPAVLYVRDKRHPGAAPPH